MNKSLSLFIFVISVLSINSVVAQPTGNGKVFGIWTGGFSTEFARPPDNIDGQNGWIEYGAHIALIFGGLFLMGMLMTLILWIFACCHKCGGMCKPKLEGANKNNWFLGYLVFYIAFCIFGIIAIIMTFEASRNINGGVESVKKAGDDTAAGIVGVNQDIQQTKNDLINEILNADAQLSTFSFNAVRAYLSNLDFLTNETLDALLQINVTLTNVGFEYQDLISNYTYLQSLGQQGYIDPDSVPGNDTVHDPPTENDIQTAQAKENFLLFRQKINESRIAVDDAENTFRAERTNQINSLTTQIDDQVRSVSNSINETGVGITNAFNRESVGQTVDPYVKQSNEIREGIITAFVLLNLACFGVWFLGARSKTGALMELPFWVGSFTLFWLLLISALHFVIWVPTRDVCDKGIPYIQSPDTAAFIRANTIDQSGNNSNLFNQIATAVLDDPYIILRCGQVHANDTFLVRLNIDISDQLPDVNAQLDSFQDQFLNATGRLDTNQTAQEAINSFNALQQNISDVLVQLSDYDNDIALNRQQLANISVQITQLERFGYNQSIVDGLFVELNTYTEALTPPDTWAMTNISQLTDAYITTDARYNTQTPQWQQDVRDRRDAILNLNQTYTDALNTIATVQQVSANMNASFDVMLVYVQEVRTSINQISGNVTNATNTLIGLASLQSYFIQRVIEIATVAVANVKEILKLKNIGKCKFIGDFWHDGIEQNVCSGVSANVGASAFMILLFSLMIFFSFPLIFYSKIVFLEAGAEKNVRDEDL